MADCLIACGSNQGDRGQLIRNARQLVDALPQTCVRAMSQLVETCPVGLPLHSDRFLNACLRLDTGLSPLKLMEALLEIESNLGRNRRIDGLDRPIDLDILLFCDDQKNDLVISNEALQIPHPRMSFRRFALIPAQEIAPQMYHPVCQMTISELLDHLDTTPNLISTLIADPQIHARITTEVGKDLRPPLPTVRFIDGATGAPNTNLPADWTVAAYLESTAFMATQPKLRMIDANIKNANELSIHGPVWEFPVSDTSLLFRNILISIEAMLHSQ